MSDRKALDGLGARLAKRVEQTSAPDPEPADDYRAFGWLRGIRDRATMLELRRKDGNILALAYAWLEKVEFDPSVGITLHIAGERVFIAGRNLNHEIRPTVRLFEGLTRHRVPWIQEAGLVEQLNAEPDEVVVELIDWDTEEPRVRSRVE